MESRTEEIAVEKSFADELISLFNPTTEKLPYPLDRMFSLLGDNEDMKQNICDKILNSDQANDKKYAAIVLFKLHDQINRHELPQIHQDLISAINDMKLSLAHTNIIFSLYYDKPFMTNSPDRNSWTKAVLPTLHSPEWQKTVAEIRKIAFVKLRSEVEKLTTAVEKLAYLQEAKAMPIFNIHQNNFVFTGAFGRTGSVITIDSMIEDVKLSYAVPEKFEEFKM